MTTPTNNQIYMSAITILNGAALGYPISYPGYNFTPPATGAWLQVKFFPNEGLDMALNYDNTVIPRGMLQVAAVIRKGTGIEPAHAVAEEVRALYSKGTQIEGRVRVIREPWFMEVDTMEDRLMVLVTIEYSG